MTRNNRLEMMAEKGPTNTVPCCFCGKPTKSHFVFHDGEEIAVLKKTNIPDMEVVMLLTCCHTCTRDRDLPLHESDSGYEQAVSQMEQHIENNQEKFAEL